MLTYALSTWSRILLNKVLHQWGVAWRWSARGSAEVLWKPRLALKAAFSSSVWLGLMSHIFLLTIQHRFSVGFRSGQLAGLVIPWSVHLLLVVLALKHELQATIREPLSSIWIYFGFVITDGKMQVIPKSCEPLHMQQCFKMRRH